MFDGKNVGNISVVSKQYNLNNGSQKDIRKVIETLNNGEKGEYIGIFTTDSKRLIEALNINPELPAVKWDRIQEVIIKNH